MGDAETLFFEATLTDKYQNTVPAPVRKALNLSKRDKIAYIVQGGRVTLEKATDTGDQVDPVVQAFLGFLEREMVENPQRLRPFGGETVRRAGELVEGVDVDLDAPLEDE